jgi:hypothetical protein
MALFLFSLRGVPDDEAEEIRHLLTSNDIAFHETSAGLFGLSTPAIWLHDEEQRPKAKALLDEHQRERFATKRAEYEALKRTGKQRTIRDVIKDNPLRFALYLILIGAVLYFSVKPFVSMGGG